MSESIQSLLESVSKENRSFPPTPEFAEKARVRSMEEYEAEYQRSIDDPEAYWAEIASELHWFKPWDRVLNEDEKPFFKWFEGGKTNLAYNCIDRHIENGDRNKAALIWEGEPGDSRVLTYFDLYREVNQFANALKKLGVGKGDRVALYLPMIPELAIATLACARIGAVHTVIFAGFSSNSIRDRVLDCGARCVITADGGWRRGQILNLKSIVDEAVEGVDCIQEVIVVKRGHGDPFPCRIKEGRDHWYHRIVQDQSIHCEPEQLDSEDMLFLLYTSGTTGKPKGIIHTVGGYMVYAYQTTKVVFDMRKEDVYWCTADIGWITGHSYILYGPLQNAASVVMYEGAPNSPDNGRFWDIVEKYGVTIFYTAPTAIRAFMKWGEKWPNAKDLSSLRLLGTVGEPINPEAWIWYHKVIGADRCPIVDTWWQTETGGILLSPLPGATPTKPGSATLPLFGIDAAVLDDEGNEQKAGILAIRKPWPGILRGIYGDPQRFKDTYWCKWNGEYYFPGDGARTDEDDYFWILGRVDDVVNVSGHRIGTAELESVFIEHPSVAESAVIGVAHEIKGQGLVAFITVRENATADEKLEKELKDLVIKSIGKFAVPEKLIFSGDLPKTRSGKIMRRLLRDIAEGKALGNVTTLADPSVVETLRKKYQEQ
ncbi:acetate--CoA ligase [Puniceicoccus vermicola]|uniref:Acetyl-coenzyme A synthetase n=3 Tax=Puniceicoccus vermicola TaxID=388746 RepID=A0A7X1E694_9BACT|nr:acetate--CoA ligase [Puniceicoccus vermicola]MBC2603906.1 acetate--CoA ligase [Puniceicoccus vermicola]